MRFPHFGEEVRIPHLDVRVGKKRVHSKERDKIALYETIENSMGMTQAR